MQTNVVIDLNELSTDTLISIARETTKYHVLLKLAMSENKCIRKAVVENKSSTKEILSLLEKDDDNDIKKIAICRLKKQKK